MRCQAIFPKRNNLLLLHTWKKVSLSPSETHKHTRWHTGSEGATACQSSAASAASEATGPVNVRGDEPRDAASSHKLHPAAAAAVAGR